MAQPAIVTSNISLDIDKNDVLAIAVSRAEAGLIQTVDNLTAQAKEKDKQAQAKRKELEETCYKNIPEEVAQATQAAKASLKTFGIATIAANYKIIWADKEYHITLTKQSAYSANRDTIAAKICTFDELNVTTLNDEIVALEEQSKELKTQALECRKKLNNIGTLERAVRGKLAEKRLRETEDGETVIQAVLADLDLNVKALPSF